MTTQKQIIRCSVCEKTEESIWNEETNEELATHNMCFNCNFWREKVSWLTNPDYLNRQTIVNGCHFMVNESVLNGFMQGSGGTPYYIHYNDGRKVVSRNVWQQGDIPKLWKDKLKDNAVFVTKDNFDK